MFNLKNLDPVHRETLDKVTNLLQQLIDRQMILRQAIKENREVDSPNPPGELSHNRDIMRYVQWVRYWLMGNSEEEVSIKTNHLIRRWSFRSDGTGVQLYPFISRLLGCDTGQNEYITLKSRKLIEYIMELCFPSTHQSLFSLKDGNYGSVILDDIRNKINDFIYPNHAT